MEFGFRTLPTDGVEVLICDGEDPGEDIVEAVGKVVDDDNIVAGF